MKSIIFHPAFVWHCPTCASRNFYAPQVEDDPEVQAEIKAQYGAEPDAPGHCLLVPEAVFCPRCEEQFEVDDGALV